MSFRLGWKCGANLDGCDRLYPIHPNGCITARLKLTQEISRKGYTT